MKENVETLIKKLAATDPCLDNLTDDQLIELGRELLKDTRKDRLGIMVKAAKLDIGAERNRFLSNYKSKATVHVYGDGLDRLDAFIKRQGLTIPELTPAKADDFIHEHLGLSSSTVRLIVAACSSFFTFLERRYDFIRNPFRGTRERPKNVSKKALGVPDSDEISAVIGSVSDRVLRAGMTILAEHGLRVGALPSLTVRGGKYYAHSKGKGIQGFLSEQSMSALAGLNLNRPFAEFNLDTVITKVQWQINKAYRKGLIHTKFSPHDLRHAFAVREYGKDKDIVKLKNQLGHSSIAITDRYLRSLENI